MKASTFQPVWRCNPAGGRLHGRQAQGRLFLWWRRTWPVLETGLAVTHVVRLQVTVGPMLGPGQSGLSSLPATSGGGSSGGGLPPPRAEPR